MRSVSGLWDRLVSIDHIEHAAARTVRGKRRRPDVAWFLFDRERHLARLRQRLLDGTWRPGPFSPLIVREPKPRVIARASVTDRVAGSAVAMLLEPIWLRSAIDTDFACRRGLGTHHAVLRVLELLRRHRFVVHLDVRAYFPSIRVDLLQGMLDRRLREERMRDVVARILASGRGFYDAPWIRRLLRLPSDWPVGRGLPMGSVTSQLFAAHVYLQDVDHWIQRELRVGGYVRYVDDLFVFGDCRADLRHWRRLIRQRLLEELDLGLKHPDTPVLSCSGHLDALGYRVRRTHLEPLPKTWCRLRRRLADWVHRRGGIRSGERLRRSLLSAAGHWNFG